MSGKPSYGDGRRMSVAEAVERRARMIRVWGSLDGASDICKAQAPELRRHRPWMKRAWTGTICFGRNANCCDVAASAEDAAEHPVHGRFIVPACASCREGRS